ncbi:MAG: response regulator transcription factor [Armatimonadota bacterium]|nr:response regulator transcription factor [Armatimonadota bacterium]
MSGKILLVEDDPAIVQSLMRLLSREGYFVAARSSGEEAVALLRDDPTYDLVLLDVGLPGATGFECCRQLRAQGWHCPILMLTGRAASADRIAGLDVGADDYIAKPFHPNELLARVRAHLRRTRDYDAPTTQTTEIRVGPDLALDLRIRDAVVQGKPAHLTDREYELLLLLARHLGTALDKTWLFQQVWGNAPEMSFKALAVYIRRLRQKIEVDEDNPRYIQTVRGFGYKLSGEEIAP